jgi:Ca-activated chloride channel family protein
VEEMINYFHYDYKQPKDKDPFSVDYQLSECPWNKDKKLLHIGLQGKIIPLQNLAPSNLVFLIDVSGSMNEPNKLPLLISAFKLLTEQLRKKDRVSIVVYAGNTGVVLPSTEGNRKAEIFAALDKLQAGGSTAGGAGLQLAYKIAEENFIENGNNRIVLATDGDFNVGASSNEAMENMIVGYRDKKIYISVLGFGMGNYKDDKMELIADKGNGNYAYIDNLQEAKRTLVTQFAGTLYTIAKDVKIQVEFNPSVVDSFRLIGYEDRMLSKEDFKDDKKDAGEIGSGHTVTALYEITPTKKRSQLPHSLKYRNSALNENNKNMVTI